jgi:site-specific DNA-cytosine methylase
LSLIDRIAEVRPPFAALENVPEFAPSRAHTLLRKTLDRCGYCVQEQVLCPTQLGVPMRRERFYLVASRGGGPPWTCRAEEYTDCAPPRAPIAAYLDGEADENPSLRVDAEVIRQYAGAIHIIDRHDKAAIAHCFTAAYGRSIVRSGSYVRVAQRIRRFSPLEIARLMGLGPSFRFPHHVTKPKAWQLVGNSLSVDAVRSVLSEVASAFPTLQE